MYDEQPGRIKKIVGNAVVQRVINKKRGQDEQIQPKFFRPKGCKSGAAMGGLFRKMQLKTLTSFRVKKTSEFFKSPP